MSYIYSQIRSPLLILSQKLIQSEFGSGQGHGIFKILFNKPIFQNIEDRFSNPSFQPILYPLGAISDEAPISTHAHRTSQISSSAVLSAYKLPIDVTLICTKYENFSTARRQTPADKIGTPQEGRSPTHKKPGLGDSITISNPTIIIHRFAGTPQEH